MAESDNKRPDLATLQSMFEVPYICNFVWIFQKPLHYHSIKPAELEAALLNPQQSPLFTELVSRLLLSDSKQRTMFKSHTEGLEYDVVCELLRLRVKQWFSEEEEADRKKKLKDEEGEAEEGEEEAEAEEEEAEEEQKKSAGSKRRISRQSSGNSGTKKKSRKSKAGDDDDDDSTNTKPPSRVGRPPSVSLWSAASSSTPSVPCFTISSYLPGYSLAHLPLTSDLPFHEADIQTRCRVVYALCEWLMAEEAELDEHIREIEPKDCRTEAFGVDSLDRHYFSFGFSDFRIYRQQMYDRQERKSKKKEGEEEEGEEQEEKKSAKKKQSKKQSDSSQRDYLAVVPIPSSHTVHSQTHTVSPPLFSVLVSTKDEYQELIRQMKAKRSKREKELAEKIEAFFEELSSDPSLASSSSSSTSATPSSSLASRLKFKAKVQEAMSHLRPKGKTSARLQKMYDEQEEQHHIKLERMTSKMTRRVEEMQERGREMVRELKEALGEVEEEADE